MAVSDPLLKLLAIIVIVITAPGIVLSILYAIPYCLRRVRRYPRPGSRRMFARMTLFSTVTPFVCLLLFLSVGIVAVAVEDADLRTAISRALIMPIIVLLAVQSIAVPVWHSYIEAAAASERKRQDREIREET